MGDDSFLTVVMVKLLEFSITDSILLFSIINPYVYLR